MVRFYTGHGLPIYNVLKHLINFWSHYYSFSGVAPNRSVVFVSQASSGHENKNADFLLTNLITEIAF